MPLWDLVALDFVDGVGTEEADDLVGIEDCEGGFLVLVRNLSITE